MKQQTTLPFDSGVASKLEAILQRCSDKVKLGSSMFDERGEAAARAIAATDRASDGVVAKRPEKAQGTSTH